MFKEILATTALAAIAAITAGTSPANALVALGHKEIGHVARHLGASAANHAVVHRKRNAHRQRRACIPHPPGDVPGPSPSQPPSNGGNNNPPPSPPPPTPPTPPSGSRSKVGLAWGPDVPKEWIPNIVNAAHGNVGYVYNWSPWKFEDWILNGAKFAPMLWGWDQIDLFERTVQPGYADVVLGPNEVNQSGQAQMSPESAAALWHNHIARRKEMGYRLGSPCTTNAPDGLPWMRNWYNQVWPKPDFITIHWYGVDLQNFKDYVTQVYNEFKLPIWVTEYACTDFSFQRGCDVEAFTREATNWMDQQWFVEQYFQFGWVNDLHGVSEVNRLVDLGSGWPSWLGNIFLNE